MRAKRKRSAEHLESDRRATRRRRASTSGIPKLGLWECGIGSAGSSARSGRRDEY